MAEEKKVGELETSKPEYDSSFDEDNAKLASESYPAPLQDH